MSLNIKNYLPLFHPPVTYPEKSLCGNSECNSDDQGICPWERGKFVRLIKKNKKTKEEASPLKKLNII